MELLIRRFSSLHQVDLEEAKSHLADLIDIALGGDEVIITIDNQPVLKLVPVTISKKPRKAGSAKGLITMFEDFDEPLEDFKEYME